MNASDQTNPSPDEKLESRDDDGPELSNWGLFKKTWPLIRGPRAKLRAVGLLLLRALP